VTEPSHVWDAARATADSLTELDMGAHAASKSRAREHLLEAVRAAIAKEFGAQPSRP
jgi:enoyl-CoA hydratase